MSQPCGVLHVVHDNPRRGSAVARDLADQGFPVQLVSANELTAGRPLGDPAVVVLMQPADPQVMALLLEGTDLRRHRNRTVFYAQHRVPKLMAALERLGVTYVHVAGAKPEGLLFIISQIDLNLTIQALAARKERHDRAGMIFGETNGLFRSLDSSTTLPTTIVTEIRDRLANTLDNTPMGTWLTLIRENQNYTMQHCTLVTTIAMAFARRLACADRDMVRVFEAAFFHDVGKSVVPIEILEKPAKLTGAEMQIMRAHVTAGFEMLRRFPETAGEVADVARSHHEYLDGSGYPDGLRGAAIPDLVRLVTIADVFAALLERRSYKAPMAPDRAYAMLRAMEGKLDGDMLRVFEDVAAEADRFTFA